MDDHSIRMAEKRMQKENAISVLKKLLSGAFIILGVGIAAYLLLFVLMLII